MRPVRLEMEGFATFRSRTVLDFDDLDLVAFVGATGSGKSTIIDAFTFALYGSVARYDNTNVVAPVIHQLSTEAKVRFDFELAEQRFSAVRVVRRRGGQTRVRSGDQDVATGSANATGASGAAMASGATTKEARLERFVDGDSVEVLAGNVRELNAAVTALLGLDFGQFTRTVVLPQGQFAQFLKDEPSSRQKLLRSLLDLEIYHRMGVVARETAKRMGQQAEALEAELARQPLLTDSELDDCSSQVDALTELRKLVATKLDELATIDAELDPVRNHVTEIDEQIQRLRAIEVPARLAETDRLLAEAGTSIAELEIQLAAKRQSWEEHQEAVAAGTPKSELLTVLDQIESLAATEADLDVAKNEQTELADRLKQFEQRIVQLKAEADQAAQTLASVRRSADADAWITQLVTGEPCPVCHQIVADMPAHLPDDALADAEAGAAAANHESHQATGQQASLNGSLKSASQQVDRLSRTVAELLTAIDGQNRKLIGSQLAEIEERAAKTKVAYEEMSGVDQRLRKLLADRNELNNRTQDWNVTFSGQRDEVSAYEPPALQHQSLFADWTALAGWAAEQSVVLAERRDELANRGKTLAGQRKQSLSNLVELAEPYGISVEPESMSESVAVARSEAAGRLDAARERQREQQRLQGRVDELSADREINNVLGQHLSASGFEGWLLNEALDNIVGRATNWLRELSGGAYSLAVNNRDFAIIDHNNADEWRDVRTLSGGETFLTSLSLALALADSIAELAPIDAPRLQSMFLDEGFGTLDGATLDVVACAIEELASTGRMIGIVTHVRDLAERLPARFEVLKTTSGSAVELVQV